MRDSASSFQGSDFKSDPTLGKGAGVFDGLQRIAFQTCPFARHHPSRSWRAEFPHQPSRTLIEIEGGIYVNGRHNRGAGFAADLEKYLEAALAGWRVVRLGPNELTAEHIGRLVALVSDDSEGGL